jgi:uncharacterized DUF497 family protein
MFEAFEWDDANLRHIAVHGVLPQEAEEVVLSSPLDLDYSDSEGEGRFRQVGETRKGRILVVVTTERGARIRVVTAYPGSAFLKETYLRYKESLRHGEAGSA